MQRIIWIVVLAALGWYGWGRYEAHVRAERAAEAAEKTAKKALPATGGSVTFFSCDARNTCAQMTSCEEAKFFVRSCPGMNPQGTRESTTCEQQWCK